MGFCKPLNCNYTIVNKNTIKGRIVLVVDDIHTQLSKQFYCNTAFLATKIESLLHMKHM